MERRASHSQHNDCQMNIIGQSRLRSMRCRSLSRSQLALLNGAAVEYNGGIQRQWFYGAYYDKMGVT